MDLKKLSHSDTLELFEILHNIGTLYFQTLLTYEDLTESALTFSLERKTLL